MQSSALNAQNRAASLTLALGAPFVVVFLLIPDLIVAAAFERGALQGRRDPSGRAVLAAYSLGMPALFVDRIVSASFISRGDTATPMKVTLVGVALNVALKIALYRPLGAPGLALATAAGLWIKVVGVFALARRRGWTAPDRRFIATAAATLFASRRARPCSDARRRAARWRLLARLPRFAREIAAPDPRGDRRRGLFPGARGRAGADRRDALRPPRPDDADATARPVIA